MGDRQPHALREGTGLSVLARVLETQGLGQGVPVERARTLEGGPRTGKYGGSSPQGEV